ncbi:hypothetical protein [Gryllotalpicola sp.]|uniref:hypothetical protein n=1 Tax=Gryllotalpicola sp. TaxID=1932787 RepID=UPI00260EC984|nr:hypothetical protein [Gryllotalpicola sp.]
MSDQTPAPEVPEEPSVAGPVETIALPDPVSAAQHANAAEPATPVAGPAETTAEALVETAAEAPVESPASLDAPTTLYQPPVTGGYPLPQPTFVAAPLPPTPRGNRGFGILFVIVGAIVFGVLECAAVYGLLDLEFGGAAADAQLGLFLQSWSFWLPFAVFTLAFLALTAIANRGGWWAYVLGAIPIAALVFAAYLGAALFTLNPWENSWGEVGQKLGDFLQAQTTWVTVSAIAVVIALEVVTWLGLPVARRGKAVAQRNAEAKAGFAAEHPGLPPVL